MIQDFPSPQPVLSQGNKGCSCAPSWLSSSESLSTPAPLPVAGLQDPFSKWEISPPRQMPPGEMWILFHSMQTTTLAAQLMAKL